MKRLVQFITSIRLAIALIAYLAISSVIATLASDDSASFFGSALFILPAFVFFANLSACTVRRFARELGKTSRRRHGPDILHVGLMILVVGGIASFSGRRELSVELALGQSARLPGGAIVNLDGFSLVSYDDGRSPDWVSVISVDKDGVREMEAVAIRVNAPFRYAGFSLYQVGFSPKPDGTKASVLDAVSDPGYPFVLLALALIAIGTTWTFAQKLKEGV